MITTVVPFRMPTTGRSSQKDHRRLEMAGRQIYIICNIASIFTCKLYVSILKASNESYQYSKVRRKPSCTHTISINEEPTRRVNAPLPLHKQSVSGRWTAHVGDKANDPKAE